MNNLVRTVLKNVTPGRTPDTDLNWSGIASWDDEGGATTSVETGFYIDGHHYAYAELVVESLVQSARKEGWPGMKTLNPMSWFRPKLSVSISGRNGQGLRRSKRYVF